MKNFKRKSIEGLLVIGYFAGMLLIPDTGLSLKARIIILGSIYTGYGSIYLLLPKLIEAWINRSAEYLSAQGLVSRIVLASTIMALLIGIGGNVLVQWLFGLQLSWRDSLLNLGLFVLISAALSSLFSLRAFVGRWKSLLEMEQTLKQTVLKAEFESLKAQVNPHFLFNSLNILSALIPEDPANSVQLVERLSKVFRYALQNTEKATIELGTELKIVESYLFIHKMRFGDNLRYDIQIQPADLGKQVVTQGLLTLVENALKHNECSREKPLNLRIGSSDGWVVVTNTRQRKNLLQTDSTGLGLKNLRLRYSLLNQPEIVVTETDQEFIVKLPLL